MTITVEGEDASFWPDMLSCPEHGLPAQFVESISGIHKVACFGVVYIDVWRFSVVGVHVIIKAAIFV